MMHGRAALVAAVTLAAATTACGYGYQHTSLSMGPNPTRFSQQDPTYTGTMSAGVGQHVLTMTDVSGTVTAHMGTLGNKYLAEQKAREAAAKDRNVKVGDTVTYEYTRFAPAPGRVTNIRFAWGDTDGVEIGGVRMDTFRAGGWSFEVDEGLGGWELGPIDLSINIGARFQKWRVETGGVYEDVAEWRMGLPVLIGLGYHVIPTVHAALRANLDTVSALTGLADQPAWLDAQAQAIVRWTPVPFVSLSAEASAGKASFDLGGREVGVFMIGAYLTFHGPTEGS